MSVSEEKLTEFASRVHAQVELLNRVLRDAPDGAMLELDILEQHCLGRATPYQIITSKVSVTKQY